MAIHVDTVKKICAFAYSPHNLRMCGPGESCAEVLEKCAATGDCTDAIGNISSFATLWPYLLTLSELTGYGIWSREVGEAYIIGDEVLKRVQEESLNNKTPDPFEKLLNNLSTQEEHSPEFIHQLRVQAPKPFTPHHFFQVLLASGVIAEGTFTTTLLTGINSCMVSWGEVIKVNADSLQVNLMQLKPHRDSVVLKETATEIAWRREFIPKVSVGEVIASHWENAIFILDKEKGGSAEKLEYWTSDILGVFLSKL